MNRNRLWIAAAVVALCVLPAIFRLIGSKQPVTPETQLSQEQSLAVLRDYVYSQPAIFDMTQYNPVGDAHVERLIQQAIADDVQKRNFGSWPATGSAAKAFGYSIAGNAWRRVLDDDAGRTAIEQQMLAYWNNPQIEKLLDGESVMMNLGTVPGKIKLNSKGYYTIPQSEFEVNLELQPAELVRRLKQMQADFPEMRHYRITVITTPSYRDHTPLTYAYDRQLDLLTVHDRPELYQSPQPIAGLDRLVTGEAPVHTSDLKNITTSRVGSPR